MTFTYHGIGTRYVGNKNLVDWPAECPWCHKASRLCSYDTRLWIVVVYLPVIPLQKLRILDECPRCKKHRTVSYSKWELIQDEARNKASQLVQDRRNDPASAIEAHRTLLGAHLMADALALGEAMSSRFDQSALVHVYLADIAAVQNRGSDARRGYECAYELDATNSGAREGLASAAVAVGRLDYASELLKPVIEGRTASSPSACRALAGALVRAQRHAEAHAVMIAMLEMFPTLRADKVFAKQLRACEKKLLVPRTKLGASFDFARPLVIGAVVVLLAAAGLVCADRAAAAHLTLHVVDSVDGQVDVEIPGMGSVDFDAPGRRTIQVSEGTYTAHVKGAVERDVEFTVTCSRWPRFLAHDVFVLDATGGSVVCLQTVLYTPGGKSKSPPRQLRPLHDFERFDRIDAAFEPLPHEIMLQQNGAAETRLGLSLLEGPIVMAVYEMLSTGKARPAFDLAQARLRLRPHDAGLVYAYAEAAERAHMEKVAEAFVEPRLQARPLDIDAHYAWIKLRSRAGGWKAAADRYDDLMKLEPNETAWAMLRGLVSSSASQRVELFRRVVLDEKYACNTWMLLADAEASSGNWQAALDAARHARECDADEEEAVPLEYDALAALGRSDELELALGQALSDYACDYDALERRAEMLARQQNKPETPEARAALEKKAAQACPKDIAELREVLARADAWARGDFAAVVKQAKASKQPRAKRWLITALAEQGSMYELLSWTETVEGFNLDAYTALGVALACRAHGEVKQARMWERIGIDKLPSFGGGREAAWLLNGKRVGVADKALDLDLPPHDKAIVLALIACSDDAARTMLVQSALKLQTRTVFPHATIEWLASGGARSKNEGGDTK